MGSGGVLKYFAVIAMVSGVLLPSTGCNFIQLSKSGVSFGRSALNNSGTGQGTPGTATLSPAMPVDEREVTFPSDMKTWGWMDVTQGGLAIGCPDALAGKSDAASVTQTTTAIQCRLNNLGTGTIPGALYFPTGTYYINKTLSLTQAYYVQNPDGSYTLTYWGGGDRSEWTGEVHISGENPANTKIVWAGSCGTDPNIADPVHVTKYNDIIYVDGISPLIIERLTLDGQNCAGTGIDMVSKPGNISGVSINEMNIQNLKEVGIVGDRANLTNDEIREGDNSGMVSEVTISGVNFAHVGYACVMPNAPNAVDWWIRDSSFSDCGIAVTNSSGGTGWAWPGMPVAPALAWGNSGPGGFHISNSYFENSRYADIMGGSSVRNSFSLASKAPFLEVYGSFYAQGNTVIASKGVMPVMTWGGTAGLAVDQVVLLQNKFVTQDNDPAILAWSMVWGQSYPGSAYQGASPAVGNLWNETYSNIASTDNVYSSTQPFSTGNSTQVSADASGQGADLPGWAPSTLLGCGPLGAVSTPIDGRTFCNFPGPNMNPVFNLLTFDDQLGATLPASALTPPSLPPARPEVSRHYIIAGLKEGNTAAIFAANSGTLQVALNTLAANQSNCKSSDYLCADRWATVFIPSGTFYFSKTVDVPGGVQLQIVGTGQSNLGWGPWDGTTVGSVSQPVLKLHAPSHVVLRDFALFGQPDIHNPNPLGEGLVAEVTDLSTSRVFSDSLRLWDGFNSIGIGNADFDMRSFGTGAASMVTGNGGQNAGYFAFYSGNPDNITVGQGANLMIQDTWYEGGETAIATCANGEFANITVESSNLTPGGWHGVFATPLTSFNIGGCKTKTALIGNNLSRDGYAGLAPTASVVLPAAATAQTEVLTLANFSINSTYGNSEGNVPANFNGSIDQGYLSVDPATQAQYADIFGVFFTALTDTNGSGDQAQLAAKQTGLIQSSFVRSMLGQAMDARQMSAPRLLTPITDMQSTDIRIEHVWMASSSKNLDMQFILPGATAQ